MKKHFLTIAALAAAALSAQAQTDVLYVQDATTYYEEFKVSDVSEFDAANPMTITFNDGTTRTINDPYAFWFGQLAALSNQYEYKHGMDQTYNGIHDLTNFRAVQHYNPLTQAVDSTDYHLDDVMVLHVNSENRLPYTTVAGELFKVWTLLATKRPSVSRRTASTTTSRWRPTSICAKSTRQSGTKEARLPASASNSPPTPSPPTPPSRR
mgnify:CR=1 FL=1